ncbi:MAG TPA: glycosyltransferase [Gemmatimonadales bacterium]|nr:glycosyltransferase [Gemmatimonadales bacterium]
MLTDAAGAALVATLALALYTYLGYPLALLLVGAVRRRRYRRPADEQALPFITVAVAVHNGGPEIAAALDAILAADYPPERRHVLVVSDASTDDTDAIVRRYSGRGVELLRLPARRGKTGAENAGRSHVRGTIVVNTDAGVRIDAQALRRLVRALADPEVGVASGRDVSVADPALRTTSGERGYVGYEMWVRNLETRVGSIVGASGCLYAIRTTLHDRMVPENLSRDFSAALDARRRGFRAVSVPDAVCYVPRSGSLHAEYRRKVRTIARGIATLAWERRALDPIRAPLFAWMVLSHKICRWLLPAAAVVGILALFALAISSGSRAAWTALAAATIVLLLASAAWQWPADWPQPRWIAWPAFAVWGNVAVLHAAVRVWRGTTQAVWEPTRRTAIQR